MASIGDLVHGSDSEVFDPNRRWAVGVLQRRVPIGDKILYAIGPEKHGKTWGLWSFIKRLEDEKEARQVVRAMREAREEQSYARQPMGDQIREFLRQEAAFEKWRRERDVSET